MMNLIHYLMIQRLYFYFFVFIYFLFLFFNSWRLWNMISTFTDSLSIVLNDNQILGNITKLLSQVDSFNNYATIWNGKLIRWLKVLLIFLFLKGTILTNITTSDFNQSIPLITINILFSSFVNLSNLHQSWFMNRTNSLSNIEVAAEIYIASIQSNYSYVSFEKKTNVLVFC
jgi:hypothetical protein